MLQQHLSISTREVSSTDAHEASPDSRFDRFRLIGWWDQRKLAAAKVVVAGAGALGNEIVKNLALLGVGNVLIADKDRIEHSNLSRSILYRAADAGRYKAQVAARAARDVYPEMNAHAFVGDLVNDLGAGVYRWADLVIGGLDNREARLSINRQCWRVGRPWVDGAIEQIEGTARVFDPRNDGPCYECTMSERDWQLLQSRRSCNQLTRTEMEGGKTPTTPTISSIVAGVQCQEAVKLLHGLETIGGRGWVFSGLATDAYQTEFQRKPDCFVHDALDEIVTLDAGADTMTVADLLEEARKVAGSNARVELGRDVIEKLACPRCGADEQLYAPAGRVSAAKAACPRCDGHVRRAVVTFDAIRGTEPAAFLGRTLADVGVPPFDVLTVRDRMTGRAVGLELAGDAARVLGPLAGEGLEWT